MWTSFEATIFGNNLKFYRKQTSELSHLKTKFVLDFLLIIITIGIEIK